MKLIKTIYKRLRSKTPKFFKVIRNVSIAVAVAAGAATTLYATFDDKIKESIPIEYVKTLGISALTATIVAQLTKQDGDNDKNDKV